MDERRRGSECVNERKLALSAWMRGGMSLSARMRGGVTAWMRGGMALHG